MTQLHDDPQQFAAQAKAAQGAADPLAATIGKLQQGSAVARRLAFFKVLRAIWGK